MPMNILNCSILSKLRPRSSIKFKHRVTIAGRTFGHLKVYGFVGYHFKDRAAYWLCRCLCGNWSIVNRNKLGQKRTTSCGCRSAVQRTHGMRQTRVYRLWVGMLTRARNPNTKSQHNYIGRGIRACEGLYRFENFYALLSDPPRKQSIDRINNEGHYSCGQCPECCQNNWPMNLKWSTSKEQNRNRRDNRMITIGTETKCLADWAEYSGVNDTTAWYRLKGGWTPEQAFGFQEPPSRKGKGGRPKLSPHSDAGLRNNPG
jgi:transcription elongation factor Elf1